MAIKTDWIKKPQRPICQICGYECDDALPTYILPRWLVDIENNGMVCPVETAVCASCAEEIADKFPVATK